MHSHAQSRAGLLLQAMDGVTTALDLELGAASVSDAVEAAERGATDQLRLFSGLVANEDGFALDNAPLSEPFSMFSNNQTGPNWNMPASRVVARRCRFLLF